MKLDRRLLFEAWAARLALALTIGLGFLGGVVIVAQARFLSLVVSQVFLDGRSLDQVMPLLFAFLALSLGRAGLVWGAEVSASRVAGRVKDDLRNRLAAHLLALGPLHTRTEKSGELTATVIEGIEALDAYFRQYLPQLALAALIPLTILFVVFPLDWISGLVLLLTAPLIPLFMVLIGSAAETLTQKQWTSLSRMSAHFLDVLQGLTTLKLLGRSREQVQVIAQVSHRFRRTTMEVLRVAFLSALVLEMVATISTAVVAVQIAIRLLGGHMAFDQALFVLLLAPEFYQPLRLLGTRFHAGMAGVAAAERIFEVLDLEPEAPSPVTAIPQIAPQVLSPPLLSATLRFSDVHYAYDQGQRPALNGLTLEIQKGETVALVGSTGSGKSTVAYLLLRFIAPVKGRILVDERPLSSLPAAAWRQQVAWVPQLPYLFQGTVAGNIRLADPQASQSQIVEAARLAHAHEFVEALPQGYETLIGERGARLSGGEAQRIALARAFLKNAPLLILDEATANLDPGIEDQVQEAMQRLLRDRTVLLIAHRLGTARRADRILVMEDGRLLEQGSHATLTRQGGIYRRLLDAYSAGSAP